VRLAWFTPWPSQPSGVAGRSAELVPLLADRGHGIDVFVDEQRVQIAATASADPPEPGQVRLQSAHDFVWRQARHQYDLSVYQLGNSRVHEFIWPYVFRWPGLVVLHDARLHHARAAALLSKRRVDDYRAEFVWSHPDVSPDLAELATHGFRGVYYYQWPMIRAVMESATLIAAHSRGAVDALRHAWPDRRTEYVALGEGRAALDVGASRAAFRARLGLSDAAVVFGVFGGLTESRRLPQILRAFAGLRSSAPDAQLLLAGAEDPLLDARALAQLAGVADAVRVLGPLDAATFDAAIAAVDVSINLRWPSALETSGPWLRAIAAGRPTILTDLPHLGQIRTLDPRTWHIHAPVADLSPDADAQAMAVAVDILDEDHSLRLAMRRLAADADLRRRLGAAARSYWEAEHTPGRMVDDYEHAITLAVGLPRPSRQLPPHMVPDPVAHARTIVEPFRDGRGESGAAWPFGRAPATR
jgi:glycosyltransferase involved in cell wall biosynthesis